MNEVRVLEDIATELKLIRRQFELRNKIELIREALKNGILDIEGAARYIDWLESSPFIQSIQKGDKENG